MISRMHKSKQIIGSKGEKLRRKTYVRPITKLLLIAIFSDKDLLIFEMNQNGINRTTRSRAMVKHSLNKKKVYC
jgi:hypothetical protein